MKPERLTTARFRRLALGILVAALCPHRAAAQARSLTPVAEEMTWGLRALLTEAAILQQSFLAAKGLYAESSALLWPPLGTTAGSNAEVTILQATGSGWSAVAEFPEVPGLVCAIAVGDAVPPLVAEPTDGIACAGEVTVVLLEQPNSEPPPGFVPPTVKGCSPKLPFPVPADGRVVLDFTISPHGVAEPSPIQVESTEGHLYSFAAFYVIGRCAFTPGRIGKQAVATRVRRPIDIKTVH